MFPRDQNIRSFDPEIAAAIGAERLRQEQITAELLDVATGAEALADTAEVRP